MHLARLYIENFRSIRKLDLQLSKGKNVIVGRNNAGKSNIIKALDLVLGQSNPTYAKSENITGTDFHTWKETTDNGDVVHSADDVVIWCELVRDAGEALDYDELYKCYGFYIHSEIVEWEGRRPVKRPLRISKNLIPDDLRECFAITEEESTEKEYVNPKLRNQRTFEQQFDNKHLFALAFRATKDIDGRVVKDIRFLYRESEASDWILCFKAPIRNELLQSAIIPSFRDPQNQLRLSTWTWYGKLMQHLTAEHANSDDLKDAFDDVKEVADKIFENARTEIAQSALDVAFPGTELHFQFNPDTKFDLYKSCLIYVDDGFKSELGEKGSGIISATIIGLFNFYTQRVNTIASALLCIEEPELYLHPHARRVISDRLDDFLDGNRNQVVLTTHSVEFIRTSGEDLNLILVQKTDHETRAIPVHASEFRNLLINNNQNELFFADKVILCEGHEDYVIRAICRELFPKHLDEQNVSLISVGGKDNLSQLARLVIKLGIKCFVLADFDYLLRDQSEERKQYGDVQAHESVESLGEAFFSQTCILGPKGKVSFRYIQKLRARIRNENQKEFYTAKTAAELNRNNIPAVLKGLRENGVCILTGELEHASRNQTFLSPTKKLTLNRVYDLHSRLSAGEKITDVFDCGEITEFLAVVFDR